MLRGWRRDGPGETGWGGGEGVACYGSPWVPAKCKVASFCAGWLPLTASAPTG